ncbi:MAG: hypothetical protein ACOZBL_04205 [Patescibacteria group bacterium]
MEYDEKFCKLCYVICVCGLCAYVFFPKMRKSQTIKCDKETLDVMSFDSSKLVDGLSFG